MAGNTVCINYVTGL